MKINKYQLLVIKLCFICLEFLQYYTCIMTVFAVCDDLAAKENELDRLLSICSSNIATMTRNGSSTQYPSSHCIRPGVCQYCCLCHNFKNATKPDCKITAAVLFTFLPRDAMHPW